MKKLLFISLTAIWLCSTSFIRSYPSEVTYCYDGDTVTLSIDCGLDISKVEKVRLYGIDAPELRGEERYEGLKSRDALRTKINGKTIRLETIKNDERGKYGRLLGIIWLGDENINDWMVSNGHAVYRDY